MRKILACFMSIVLACTALPAVGGGFSAHADDALPNVAHGSYGTDVTVRRLYTRPVTLAQNTADDQYRFRTVAIDLRNPVYDGASLAVRYTGARPYLGFYDIDWKGWTSVYADGAHTAAADDGTGQHVAFFPLEKIETRWAAGGGASGYKRECVSVCVATSGADAGECRLVELVALGGAARIDPTKSASYNKKSGLSAWEITRGMKAGYNLGGHLEANYVPKDATRDGGWGRSDLELEAHWTRGIYITRETIQNLRKEGFKAIRLPVTWFQHIYPANDPAADVTASTLADPLERYHIDRAWMERVHEVVDWCIAQDMYVIVNMHHENWIDREDLATAYAETDLPERFAAVWIQIADEFSGYDQHLVFEDMNEPHAPYPNSDGTTNWGYASEGSVDTVNRLNADFVTLMRDTLSGHSQRLLMLAHDTGNGDLSYTNFKMPADAAGLLAHSIHCYTPHSWTHYFAEGRHAGEEGAENVYTQSYRTEVETAWQRLRERYTAQGWPVVLGEFGCYYYGESRQQDRLDWMEQYATHAKELGIPLFYWRMDLSTGTGNASKVIWTAFDEEKQEISPRSSEMIARWFSVLGDESVRWGSLASIAEGEHADIDGGVQVGASRLPATVVSRQASENGWYVRFDDASWGDIEGCEVAVRYSGDTPRLQTMNERYKGDYWGIAPDSIDYEKGIAYFRASSIKTRWESLAASGGDIAGSSVDDICRIGVCAADSGSTTPVDAKLSTTIEQVALVHQHDWSPWKPAGLTTDGEQTETCVCTVDASHTLTRTLHAWSAWKATLPATMSADGIRTRTCSECGKTQTASIPALGHIKIDDFATRLSASSFTYAGGAVKPAVSPVKIGARTLKAAEYAVTYKNNTAVGAATATVTLTGVYSGSKTLAFSILPKGTGLTKLKRAKRGFTAKWNKQAVQTSGYELQYATSKSFAGAKTVRVAKAKATSKKIGKLKRKKRYYVRVRTYKMAGGAKYASAWSATKAVKVK